MWLQGGAEFPWGVQGKCQGSPGEPVLPQSPWPGPRLAPTCREPRGHIHLLPAGPLMRHLEWRTAPALGEQASAGRRGGAVSHWAPSLRWGGLFGGCDRYCPSQGPAGRGGPACCPSLA